MSGRDPRTAPPRPDLTFLRHRARPVVAPPPPPPAPPAPAPAPPAPAPTPTPTPTPAPALAPVIVQPLSAQPPTVPAPTDNLLDLSHNPFDAPRPPVPVTSTPAAFSTPSPTTSTPASLTPPAAPSAARPTAPPPPASVPPATPRAGRPRSRTSGFVPRRVKPGIPAVLTPKDPAVTLTRVQSGIGVLRIEAACSTADGHLRVGAAYQLADGRTSIVQRSTGQLTAPNRSNRPVVIAERAEFEQIRIDLRQVRELQRLLVFAAAPPGVAMNWGGTLVTTARSTARVELPLDRPAASGVLVMASYYVVDGEITIRAEMELFATTTRDAVTAHGFDRIAWLDPYTPLD